MDFYNSLKNLKAWLFFKKKKMNPTTIAVEIYYLFCSNQNLSDC